MVNPNILLQGIVPDTNAAVAAGNQSGFQAGQMSRDAAMQRLLQGQGAKIAAGDQGAVNMLAQFDPMAARGIMAEEDAKRRAAAAAAAQAEAQAEAKAAQEEMRQLAILHINARQAMAGGPTQEAAQAMDMFNTAMSQSEIGSLGVDFDTFPEISQMFNEKIGSILNPAPVKGEEINGQLVDPFTGELMGDYRTPEQPSPGFRQATPEEANALGYVSGQFDESNGRFYGGPQLPSGGQPSEAEDRIARLEALGFPLDIATGVVDGTIKALPSATGRSQLVQMLPGGGYREIQTLTPEQSAGIDEIGGDAGPSIFDDVDASNALGVIPKLKSGISLVAQGFGVGSQFEGVSEARTALENLSTRTMLVASVNFPGRPSNLTREKIEGMTVKPGEWFQGNSGAIKKVDDIILDLSRGLNAARNVLDNPQKFTPMDVANAQAAYDQHLRPLLTDYRALREQLQAGLEPARIEVDPADVDLMNRLLDE